MYRILIVEDDMVIAKAIASHLSSWEYEVKYATDFKNIVELYVEFKPHIILLDIALPFYNGYHWCNEIRRLSKVPIVFISSTSDNINIVMAMDMGADDFIVKPFDLNVLRSKINALIRRTYSFQNQTEVLQHRGVILDLNNVSLIFDNNEIELTKNEFKIMQVLMENKDKVVSRNTLMNSLWDDESFIDDNTLTVNIARLRRKLDEEGIYDFIKTKKNLGYLID